MVFLRSCVLSISNIVSYSYIGCRELVGSILVFHWGLFGLLYGLLYLTISFFTFVNYFSSFIVFTDSFETISRFFLALGWIVNWFIVSISISLFLLNWFYKVVLLFAHLYSIYTLYQQSFFYIPSNVGLLNSSNIILTSSKFLYRFSTFQYLIKSLLL